MYKLAFVVPTGDSPRLWLCDRKMGVRTIMLNHHEVDEIITALLGEGWEPFGIGIDSAIWFRKLDPAARIDSPVIAIRPALVDLLAAPLERANFMRRNRSITIVDTVDD